MISHDTISVSPQVQQRIGLAAEPVVLVQLRSSLSAPAEVVADEQRVANLSPPADGWIRKLFVSVGQPVRRGQPLFEIYSPELQQRQRDYLDLLARLDALTGRGDGMSARGDRSPGPMLAGAERERLRLRTRLAATNVPEAVLQELERTRRMLDALPVLADRNGVITSIGAAKGAFVTPAQIVVSCADLDALWARITVSTDQFGRLRGRTLVELRAKACPETSLSVLVDASAAVVDPLTRTARLRVPLRIIAGRRAFRRAFTPGALLDATIHTEPRRALTVVRSAVIHTGSGDFVIVADEANHFRQVRVELGTASHDRVEVVDGLAAGQKVVTNGQFLLSGAAPPGHSDQTHAVNGA